MHPRRVLQAKTTTTGSHASQGELLVGRRGVQQVVQSFAERNSCIVGKTAAVQEIKCAQEMINAAGSKASPEEEELPKAGSQPGDVLQQIV